MSKYQSVMVVLLLSSLFAWSWNAYADEETKPKKPSDFILPELALGGFSAALGWGASALVTAPFRTSTGCKENPATIHWCALLWVAGPSLATPIGVIAVGELSGVQGNNPFAVLGSLLAGLGLFSCLVDPRGMGETVWCQAFYFGGFGLIVMPTLFATIGYNFPAHMKIDLKPSGRLILPLLDARF